jgi:cytochrome c-type biogenesis protein CcmH
MKRLLAVSLLVVCAGAFAIDPERMEDPAQQARYQELIHELRCLQCQGETIADTPAAFAVDIRRQVRTLVAEGRTNTEVKQYLADRYGEAILLKPRSPWLWIAPVVFLLGGVAIAWRVALQRRALLASDDSDPEDEASRT